MAKRKDQQKHNAMVQKVFNYMISNDYSEVKAHLPDHNCPVKISWSGQTEGHIPDASGTHNKDLHIWEIETEDTISIEHTEDQWKLFSAYAQQFNKVFHIVVPKGSKAVAERHARLWGINATFHEI